MLKSNEIREHVVVFAYHSSASHWSLGILKLNFTSSKKLNAVTLTIIDPLFKKTKTNEDVKKTLKKMLSD